MSPESRRTHQPVHSSWQPAPVEAVEVSADEIHLWRVPIDVEADYVESVYRLLADDEKQRAARYRFDRDRGRFIFARGVLRILMGRYLAKTPSEVAFDYGPNGKPFVSGRTSDFRFSVSHSHGLALYAFTMRHRIGVDLERLNETINCEALAQRFFSQQEFEAIEALPNESRSEAFFTCWTRKEAYLKARGEGLSFGLRDFTVSYRPWNRPMSLPEGSSESSDWLFLPIDAGPDYMASAVIESCVQPGVQYWQFLPETHLVQEQFMRPESAHSMRGN